MTSKRRKEFWNKLNKEKFDTKGVMACLAGVCVFMAEHI